MELYNLTCFLVEVFHYPIEPFWLRKLPFRWNRLQSRRSMSGEGLKRDYRQIFLNKGHKLFSLLF